jgi:hypothetical protein
MEENNEEQVLVDMNCYSCGLSRLLIVGILNGTDGRLLMLKCGACGKLQGIPIDLTITKPKPIKEKRDTSYLG